MHLIATDELMDAGRLTCDCRVSVEKPPSFSATLRAEVSFVPVIHLLVLLNALLVVYILGDCYYLYM